MRHTLFSILTVLVLLALVGTTAFAGGGNRKGTSGADQLLIPAGARGMALNGSYLSGINGVEAIYWNPAGLSVTNSSAEAMFSHVGWFGGVGVDYFALGAGFSGFGHIGFTVKSISFGDVIYTTEKTPDGTGAVYTPTFVTVGLTYSRALTDRIRAGVTANVLTERFSRSSASGVAFNVGLQYHGLGGMKGLQMGVALRNLGPNMKYEGSDLYRLSQEEDAKREAQLLKIETAGFQLPTTLEIGLAYTANIREMHAVTLTGTFQNNNFLDDQYRVGLEYSFRDFLYLRGGYNMAPEQASESKSVLDAGGTSLSQTKVNTDENTFMFGASFGIGLKYDAGDLRLGADYSYNTTRTFDGIHAFTLYVGF